MIAFTGWTWEYIDNFITLPRLFAMFDYLRKWPTVEKLVAAFVGYKEPVRIKEDNEEETVQQLINAINAVNARAG